MTQVSNKPDEGPRVREPRTEREPAGAGVVPWELGRLFTRLFAFDGEGGAATSYRSAKTTSGGVAMIDALAEQLTPRVLAGAQWPLQAVLYLPRLGRINTTVRREQGAWSIDLEAENDATARWLSGVRQQCQDRFAAALGQPVSLCLPAITSA